MATKHKLSSTFRNESLGLWYDAKSCVAQGIADLKSKVMDKKMYLDQEFLNNNSDGSSPQK